MWGVASNSLLHAEQVVNNESSAMVSSVNAIWKKSRSDAGSRGGWYDVLSGVTLLPAQGYDMLICLPLGPTCLLLGFITRSCSSVRSKSALNEKWNKKKQLLIWLDGKSQRARIEARIQVPPTPAEPDPLERWHDKPPNAFYFSLHLCVIKLKHTDDAQTWCTNM